MIPRIAITPGEPAGIGPDILLDISLHDHECEIVAFADPGMLQARAAELQLPIKIITADMASPPCASKAGKLLVVPVQMAAPICAGAPLIQNAQYLLNTLQLSTTACLNGQCDALVTGPINKGVINDAGIPFSGHTEYFADITKTENFVMMLASPRMRVALVTTHLALREVPEAITRHAVYQTLSIVAQELRAKFGIAHPCIMVAGLNPHAGENGHLGREEIDSITPAINDLLKTGHNIIGPLSADTMFSASNIKQADVFVTMYHDQGLPVLKHNDFGDTVNITLGLPFIRTSVDHGTALNLAGTGQASSSSLTAAINMAINMARASRQTA